MQCVRGCNGDLDLGLGGSLDVAIQASRDLNSALSRWLNQTQVALLLVLGLHDKDTVVQLREFHTNNVLKGNAGLGLDGLLRHEVDSLICDDNATLVEFEAAVALDAAERHHDLFAALLDLVPMCVVC